MDARKRSSFDVEGQGASGIEQGDLESSDLTFNDKDDGLFENALSDEKLSSAPELSSEQKQRIEKNRMKALALKKSRMAPRCTKSGPEICFVTGEKIQSDSGGEKKIVDTQAGFFLEEEEETENVEKVAGVRYDPAPIIEPDRPKCLDCSADIAESYLLRTFDHEVCDNCRDTSKDGKHSLITRTESKNVFLLKDCDLDVREPLLKFILRRNPHNERWGEMKLYLRLQVERRALEVWGTEEALEKAVEKKDSLREASKAKKFGKKLKALRMQVRGSLYQKKDYGGVHVHDYDETNETYDEEKDEYTRICKTCGHKNSYEKM